MLSCAVWVATASILLYRFVLHPCCFSPLAKIPAAHPLARFTSAWITLIRWFERENRTVHEAHAKHGRLVLLGPNELSVNCLQDGVSSVYGRNFDKDGYYAHFANYDRTLNMFSMLESKPHALRKRMISHVYSKSAIHSSPAVAHLSTVILGQRLLPVLDRAAAAQEPVEVLSLLFGVGMDFITAFCVGLPSGSNFVQDAAFRDAWLRLYDARNKRPFYLQNMPGLADFFSLLRIRPFSAGTERANRQMEAWVLGLVDGIEGRIAQGVAEEDEGIVYRQLKANLAKEGPGDIRLKAASELMDAILAGHETVAIVLCYALYHLSTRPELQDRLRQELLALSPGLHVRPDEDLLLPAPDQLDALPLLHAVMMETLRLNASIPGLQPRRTPEQGCKLAEFDGIPGGVRISAQAYSLHREERVFPGSAEWRPERWLEAGEEELREMKTWFWAFGSGSRMCIGSHLAQLEMKAVLACVSANFQTEVHNDSGIAQADGYTVGPKGGRLGLTFKRRTA